MARKIIRDLPPRAIIAMAAKYDQQGRMLPNRLDFWNDPDRWDGITDPHRQMFWMRP